MGGPDSSPPGLRRFVYGLLCRVIHRPGLLRIVAAALRRWPSLPFGAARIAAFKYVLTRPERFSNASHAPHLVAGEFLIGLEPGPEYGADQTLFKNVLSRLNVEADAGAEAQVRASVLQRQLVENGPGFEFDLVEDYLFRVVYRAIEPAFGFSAPIIASGLRGRDAGEAVERRHLLEARHVAAQLFAGKLAPLEVQRRAEVSAASLCARMQAALPEIAMAWNDVASDAPFKRILRNAVGLAWVSHPVTVQAGALIVQELLGRPAIYRELRQRAEAVGPEITTGPAAESFRAELSQHVRELMRFRPVFPLLARAVPRQTEFASGAKANRRCPAGSSVRAWSIGAQFDPQATEGCGRYRAGRAWHPEEEGAGAPGSANPPADADLMFGFGDRQCPAKEQAVAILTSALWGLLTLPELGWSGPRRRRIVYDGPMIQHMRLRRVGA